MFWRKWGRKINLGRVTGCNLTEFMNFILEKIKHLKQKKKKKDRKKIENWHCFWFNKMLIYGSIWKVIIQRQLGNLWFWNFIWNHISKRARWLVTYRACVAYFTWLRSLPLRTVSELFFVGANAAWIVLMKPGQKAGMSLISSHERVKPENLCQ